MAKFLAYSVDKDWFVQNIVYSRSSVNSPTTIQARKVNENIKTYPRKGVN